MKLIIDNEEVAHDFDKQANLKNVVQTVSGEIYQENRVITKYEINGNIYNDKDIELESILVGNTEEFRINTNPVKDIITDSLIEANSYLPQLNTGLEKCSILLQGEQINEAMTLLQQCVTGLGGFIEIVDKGTQLVAAVISPSAIESLPVVEKRMALNQVLNDIVENLTKSDFIMVSDLLEHELIPVINEWKILLPQLIDKLDTSLN